MNGKECLNDWNHKKGIDCNMIQLRDDVEWKPYIGERKCSMYQTIIGTQKQKSTDNKMLIELL